MVGPSCYVTVRDTLAEKHQTRQYCALTEEGQAVQKNSTWSPAATVALAPAAVSPPSLHVIVSVVKSATGPVVRFQPSGICSIRRGGKCLTVAGERPDDPSGSSEGTRELV